MEHLWWNDIKEVSGESVLLCKHVVLVCLEGDSKHVDDERAWRQVQRDAVLPQERLQLGCLLLQELQCHFCPFWGGGGDKDTGFGVTLELLPADGKLQFLTSDLMDDQVHFAVGAFSEFPDHLVVFVDLHPLQVLGCDQLQLVQNVHIGSRHQWRGSHGREHFWWMDGEKEWSLEALTGRQQQLVPEITARKQRGRQLWKLLI